MAAADMIYTRGGASDDRGESMVRKRDTHPDAGYCCPYNFSLQHKFSWSLYDWNIP